MADREPIRNFIQAKKEAMRLYNQHRQTFYCRCAFSKHLQVKFHTCGYQIRKNAKRAVRVEWEHIVPAWRFGHDRACWKDNLCVNKSGKHYGGRKCCQKMDKGYRKIENDLMNLVPAIGEVNADRKHFQFVDENYLQNQPKRYGQCMVFIDSDTKTIVPPTYTRGFIARIYLYMHKKYKISLSDGELSRYRLWHKQFPIDEWEIKRRQYIHKLQG